MPTVTRECSYPNSVLDTEAHDSGVYVMVMHLDHDLDLEIGSKGMMHFKASWADAECALADAVRGVAEWDVPKFGSSDCDCKSHLFGMAENPIHNKAFMNVVEHYRMNMLDELINR